MGARVVLTEDVRLSIMEDFLASFTSDITLHLFQNNLIVGETAVAGDFLEADYLGYVAQTVPPGGASLSNGYANVPGNKAYAGTYGAIFPGNAGSDQTVYGAYATFDSPAGSGKLLFATNCFDPQNAGSLVGKTISGIADVVGILFNLRLWDYTQDQGEVPTFGFIGLPDPPSAGVPFDMTIAALNRDRSVNVLYGGSVAIFDDVGDLTVVPSTPASLTDGVGTFNLTFASTGVHHLAVVDASSGQPAPALGATFTVV